MFQWVVDHHKDVLAVLGAAYALARVIVALTPTRADDEALEKASIFFRSLVALFGLHVTTQAEKDWREAGRPRSSGRARIEVLLVVGLLVGLLGCRSSGDLYQASSMTFVAAVDAATELRKAGKLSRDDVAAIDSAVDEGHAALSAWAKRLKAKEDAPDAEALVTAAVARIRVYLARQRE